MYPLAIGNSSKTKDRGFRVQWDGTCYIENGYLSGHIDASSGSIGGWSIFGNYLSAGKTELNSNGQITSEFFIAKYDGNILGQLGYIEGKNIVNGVEIPTNTLGLRSINGHSIRLDSDDNIALQTYNSAGSIFLSSENQMSLMVGNKSFANYLVRPALLLSYKDNVATFSLENVSAENQSGIYARFA